MSTSILVKSQPAEYNWWVPTADGEWLVGQEIIDAGLNYDVEPYEASLSNTVIAFRAVKDGDDIYCYVLHTERGLGFLGLTKIDKYGTTFNLGRKQLVSYYLAGEPNNRKSYTDFTNIKDFYIEDSGRVLHIVYAESSTVWRDIYEYDATGEYGTNWSPINTYTVYSDLHDANADWRFSADNRAVVISDFNVVRSLKVVFLAQGDHTRLSLAPTSTKTCSVTPLLSYTNNGCMLNADATQAITFANNIYSIINFTDVVNTNELVCETIHVEDDRLPSTNHMQWVDYNRVLALSQEPTLRSLTMQNAHTEIKGRLVGSAIKTFDWGYIKPNKIITITLTSTNLSITDGTNTETQNKTTGGYVEITVNRYKTKNITGEHTIAIANNLATIRWTTSGTYRIS